MSRGDIITFGVDPAYSFRDLDTGYLECLEDGKIWCSHIEELIKAGEDNQAIWAGDRLAFQLVQVPIMPTQILWLECNLNWYPNVNAYKAVFLHDGFEEFLGFIHEGEGRASLRTMFLDWFTGMVHTEFRCPSPSHSFNAQKALAHSKADKAMAFAQMFSIWRNGKCLVCAGAVTTFDDLIPEEERRRSPFDGSPV